VGAVVHEVDQRQQRLQHQRQAASSAAAVWRTELEVLTATAWHRGQ
jgi:hypothetical protein